jgi:hypothetical protein
LDKEIEKTFSQHWSIYRVAVHELGGLHLVPLFDTRISLKQLNNMLEIIEVHDAMKLQAYEQNKAEQSKKGK